MLRKNIQIEQNTVKIFENIMQLLFKIKKNS